MRSVTAAERKEYEGMIGRGFPERAVHWVLTKYRKAVQPNRRRRGARRNPDGREYVGYAKLEGIPVRIAAEYWADRWKVYGYPTGQGKQTAYYREIRHKLGDDWDFDITNPWAEPGKLPRKMQEQIADLTMPGWRTRTNRARRNPPAAGWGRFRRHIGQIWDVVYEAGLGDPTKEESEAISRLGYWGEKITAATIQGLQAGQPFPRPAFRLIIHAEDGRHEHRHRTKQALLSDARKYGPGLRRSARSWTDEWGRTMELEGATYDEAFGGVGANARRAVR